MADDSLWVRTYNVRFGDAILVSVPDRDASGKRLRRHVLFDVGNVLGGEGGDDAVFEPVLENIQEVLDGRPLDLYVMTHEHLDHVQGLLHASERLGIDLDVSHAWLTASAARDYYQRFEKARKKMELARRCYEAIERRLRTRGALEARLEAMLLNNNPTKTAHCVEHLRGLADHTHYVHRGADVTGKHPFREVAFEIWAPEEDTSDYYGRFQPLAFGLGASNAAPDGSATRRAVPPPGVDAGAFFDLVESRRSSELDNLLAIDKAKNNTSVVLAMEWRGWRLLFAGDAEIRSWRTMQREGVLKPVHFLKVSHHGSHNGTPAPDLLDRILPLPSPDGADRFAVISTCAGAYNGVPHQPTSDELAARCDITSTEGLEDGAFIDIEFPG